MPGSMVCDHGRACHCVQSAHHRAHSVCRVIRDAMVSVMFATIPSRNAVLPPPPPPTEAVERGSDVIGSNCQVEGRWSKAAHAGSATLPRTTSTCLLWCAIALGALVRGSPLTHVGGHPAETDCERFCGVENPAIWIRLRNLTRICRFCLESLGFELLRPVQCTHSSFLQLLEAE